MIQAQSSDRIRKAQTCLILKSAVESLLIIFINYYQEAEKLTLKSLGAID